MLMTATGTKPTTSTKTEARLVDPRSVIPPVILTFLAPAERCNQRCPHCFITEVAHEPVSEALLQPADFARFVWRFLDASVPIRSVKFQGYEVTLPGSWPYLEAVFSVAQHAGIHRSFITNGMLLSKWTDRIRELDPARISVSLDGSTPEANDRSRGLAGAFHATVNSLQRFLRDAPEFRDRMGVASLLRDEESFRSLLGMPPLLRRLGITRWLLSVELSLADGAVRPVLPQGIQRRRLKALQDLAEVEGLRCHTNDEFRFFGDGGAVKLNVHRVPTPAFFYRLDPVGGVRRGSEMFTPWEEGTVRRWNPATDDPLETVGYRQAACAAGLASVSYSVSRAQRS